MNEKLAAIRVQRRSLAVAIFVGTHLDYAEIHNLSSNNRKAEERTVIYARKLAEDFHINSASMEWAINGDIRKTILTDLLVGMFRDLGIPVFQAAKQQLFDAFSLPSLQTRKELGQTGISIWPILNTPPFGQSILDAAALGLYIQTERLFYH